ncbi:unnamed protein product [Medioppia subpectinata]|uniref:Chemosensory protein n=1 Tax=Medioppia subpectinata TaxID=1979941 RepID=A0A7R9LK98_9ACAR|nr:unnamed protein product [Medioppia subpectinata]CAG2119541.1 unnamed protein product [Medioppia subpectinata]
MIALVVCLTAQPFVQSGKIVEIPGTDCNLAHGVQHLFDLAGMKVEDMDKVRVELCKTCEPCCKSIQLVEDLLKEA